MYKVLSLWQPWATLLASGLKNNETRPKPTNHSHYYIHAAKQTSKMQRDFFYDPRVRELFKLIGIDDYHQLPHGAIVGRFNVARRLSTSARPMIQLHEETLLETDHVEKLLGNYAKDRWVWVGTGHQMIKNPLPYSGSQGYYAGYDQNRCLDRSRMMSEEELEQDEHEIWHSIKKFWFKEPREFLNLDTEIELGMRYEYIKAVLRGKKFIDE